MIVYFSKTSKVDDCTSRHLVVWQLCGMQMMWGDTK